MDISELPDEILVGVVSLLPLKDAVRTSVLSKRWTRFWAYITILDFNFCTLYGGQRNHIKHKLQEYADWVDQVLSSHKAPTIDEFRIQFDTFFLNARDWKLEDNSIRIDNWLRFAIEKRVKRLQIDLSNTLHTRPGVDYTMSSLPSCNSFTSIELISVHIGSETLESLLHNCRALEYISVTESNALVHLKVSGPSLKLKHLIICKCNAIEQLEISAPNLEYVCYSGPKINVQFKTTPKLARVAFGDYYAGNLKKMCSDLSSCLSQIKELRLDIKSTLELRSLSKDESVSFTRLEKLDVTAYKHMYYRGYIPQIRACPLLKHFKLRQHFPCKYMNNKKRGQREWEVCRLYNLKIVEIVGFLGHEQDTLGYNGQAVDIELAVYLDKSAVSLCKIIADTRDPRPGCKSEEYVREKARNWAEQMREQIKPTTKLEII